MTTIALNDKRSRSKNSRHGYLQTLNYIIVALIIAIALTTLIIQLMPEITAANMERTQSRVPYENLMTGTFHNDGRVNKWEARFQDVAAQVHGIILPFMTTFGISLMVISMSSTVIYLSNPEFFDEVYDQHQLVRDMRKSRQGILNAGTDYLGMLLGVNIGSSSHNPEMSFIKGVLVPDFKRLAFYEAAELGPEGKPSIGTFLKYNMPKYMMLMALIIMVNDRTMIDLYVAGAEIGVYFTQKLAYDYDYPNEIEKFLKQGSKYNSGFTGGKQQMFTKIYDALLQADKSDKTMTSEYKQSVGSMVANLFMQTGGPGQNISHSMHDGFTLNSIDYDNVSLAIHTRIDTIPYTEIPKDTMQIPLSYFGVHPEDAKTEQFITISWSVKSITRASVLATRQSSTYPDAWTVDGKSLTFDLTQTDLMSKGAADGQGGETKDYSKFEVSPVRVITSKNNSTYITKANINQDGKITVSLDSLQENEEVVTVAFTIKPPGGTIRDILYVNRTAKDNVLLGMTDSKAPNGKLLMTHPTNPDKYVHAKDEKGNPKYDSHGQPVWKLK